MLFFSNTEFFDLFLSHFVKMKLWTEVQVFFVYDTKFCQREEDDPRDAILYFHPPQMSESLRCALCCQLMGMVQFFSACFDVPSLIKLERSKFTLKSNGKYIMALGGSLDMPDAVLKKQLANLYELLVFYHESIDIVLAKCGYENLKFLKKMELMWNTYLPVSQHFGNTHSLTFDVIPTLEMPKSAGSLFLKASLILKSNQQIPGVKAGCIFCKNEIICTQLSPELMQKIGFLKLNSSHLPLDAVEVDFEMPVGVQLYTIYLNKTEQLQISDCLNESSCRSESIPKGKSFYSSSDGINDQNKKTDSSLMKMYHLYIQSHSETQLMLIMKTTVSRNLKHITTVWKSGLATLVDLEIDVKNCLESAPVKESASNYLFAQYDSIWNVLRGDLKGPHPTQPPEQVFSRTVQILHELMKQRKQIQECSVTLSNAAIYSHRMGSLETYYQQLMPLGTENWLSATSEFLMHLASKAKKRLERDHSIVLL